MCCGWNLSKVPCMICSYWDLQTSKSCWVSTNSVLLGSLFGAIFIMQSYKHSAASPNQAWLSLDLLEVLCQLAEAGHISSVRTLLEIPLQHCPELLVFGLAQIKVLSDPASLRFCSCFAIAVFAFVNSIEDGGAFLVSFSSISQFD